MIYYYMEKLQVQNSDPYAFWHSSQSKNPGLNLSVYGSSSVDEAIGKARQATTDQDIEKNIIQ